MDHSDSNFLKLMAECSSKSSMSYRFYLYSKSNLSIHRQASMTFLNYESHSFLPITTINQYDYDNYGQ